MTQSIREVCLRRHLFRACIWLAQVGGGACEHLSNVQGASSLAVRSAVSEHPALQKQVVKALGSPIVKASPKSPHFRRHGALMTCR